LREQDVARNDHDRYEVESDQMIEQKIEVREVLEKQR
jgi:hypothetical protein